MKKTFQLTESKKTPERQLDAIRHEIKKYIARERNKKVPEDFDVWDFDCAIGPSEAEKSVVQVHEISGQIDQLIAAENTSFYVEIVARAIKKTKQTPKKKS